MMMNIRGLIMDDPEHTTHLRTLQFATRTNAGSEVEETKGGEAYISLIYACAHEALLLTKIIGEENV